MKHNFIEFRMEKQRIGEKKFSPIFRLQKRNKAIICDDDRYYTKMR